jgi:DnaJ-class molecular chaperone
MAIVSDCCSAAGDGLFEDHGICPKCKEHCEYVEDDDDYGSPCDGCGGSGEVVDYSRHDQPDYQTCRECRGTGKYHDHE